MDAPQTMTVGVVKDFTTGYRFVRTQRAIIKVSNPFPIIRPAQRKHFRNRLLTYAYWHGIFQG